MDAFVEFSCQHAHWAPFIVVVLLLLSGLNIPISEDLVIIFSGALVSLCMPEKYFFLLTAVFFGAWLSGWIAYWIGRLLGEKLVEVRWFKRLLEPHRLQKLAKFYGKYGILAFIVGRFLPGGMRNSFLISVGISKIPFHQYLVRDFIACLLSVNVLFYIGYVLGNNYENLKKFARDYEHIAMGLVILLSVSFLIFFFYHYLKDKHHDSPSS